jgi:hypothetical protein
MLFAFVQHFESAVCIAEVYAAIGSEEVSLAEGMTAQMHQNADSATVSRKKAEGDGMDDEVSASHRSHNQHLESQVRNWRHITQTASHCPANALHASSLPRVTSALLHVDFIGSKGQGGWMGVLLRQLNKK